MEKKELEVQQHEDAILKTSMQFFAEEMLPYFGIEGKVASFAPTELVHLEIKKQYQDFNFVMEDGSWKHFEFQSTNEGLDGLKRFRVYEALTSYHHKVEVRTYVLFSGNIRNSMTEFTEGFNTYRVYPIIMKDKNADEVIGKIQEKLDRGEILTKADLVPLILCPLMGGEMSQKKRLIEAYRITQRAKDVKVTDIKKIEAMIYAMADKFLDSAELAELKEEIKMTRLGQMLREDGLAEGLAEGLAKGIRALIVTCQELGASKDITSEKLMQEFQLSKEEADKNIEQYWKQ